MLRLAELFIIIQLLIFIQNLILLRNCYFYYLFMTQIPIIYGKSYQCTIFFSNPHYNVATWSHSIWHKGMLFSGQTVTPRWSRLVHEVTSSWLAATPPPHTAAPRRCPAAQPAEPRTTGDTRESNPRLKRGTSERPLEHKCQLYQMKS